MSTVGFKKPELFDLDSEEFICDILMLEEFVKIFIRILHFLRIKTSLWNGKDGFMWFCFLAAFNPGFYYLILRNNTTRSGVIKEHWGNMELIGQNKYGKRTEF